MRKLCTTRPNLPFVTRGSATNWTLVGTTDLRPHESLFNLRVTHKGCFLHSSLHFVDGMTDHYTHSGILHKRAKLEVLEDTANDARSPVMILELDHWSRDQGWSRDMDVSLSDLIIGNWTFHQSSLIMLLWCLQCVERCYDSDGNNHTESIWETALDWPVVKLNMFLTIYGIIKYLQMQQYKSIMFLKH
jgi:hypothetical protein